MLVLGDAIGGGLGAGLTRVAEASGDYEVSIRFNEESGLARPEVYDWPATVPKILGSNAYDVIVVMLGANDTQADPPGGRPAHCLRHAGMGGSLWRPRSTALLVRTRSVRRAHRLGRPAAHARSRI